MPCQNIMLSMFVKSDRRLFKAIDFMLERLVMQTVLGFWFLSALSKTFAMKAKQLPQKKRNLREWRERNTQQRWKTYLKYWNCRATTASVLFTVLLTLFLFSFPCCHSCRHLQESLPIFSFSSFTVVLPRCRAILLEFEQITGEDNTVGWINSAHCVSKWNKNLWWWHAILI